MKFKNSNSSSLLDLSQETERRFQETERRFQETERKFQESNHQFREMSQESARQFREMSQETDKKINKVSQAIGQLGGRWGEFIESMVKPAVVRLFQQRGLAVHEVHHHLTSKRNGLAAEIDLLVTNDEYCVAIEVKPLRVVLSTKRTDYVVTNNMVPDDTLAVVSFNASSGKT